MRTKENKRNENGKKSVKKNICTTCLGEKGKVEERKLVETGKNNIFILVSFILVIRAQ